MPVVGNHAFSCCTHGRSLLRPSLSSAASALFDVEAGELSPGLVPQIPDEYYELTHRHIPDTTCLGMISIYIYIYDYNMPTKLSTPFQPPQ